MKKNFPKLAILLIFLFGLVLRLINLDSQPTFISDEASIGYNAFSIKETGRDEWNQFLPLSFKSFGEYKLPLYIYSAVPTVMIFGLNEFSTRLPSAIFGSLTIILVYFLIKELFRTKDEINAEVLGLLSGLFLAINPWHVQISRMAIEANLSLFLTVFGFFLLLKAKDKIVYYYPALIFFALSLYTYNASRIFVPLFLIVYFFIARYDKVSKKIIYPFLLLCVLLIPLFAGGFSGSGERLYKVGIFNDIGIINNINEGRGQCLKSYPEKICLARFNKPVVYTLEIAKNYLSHFSPQFLFINGAGLAQYTVPGQGMFYYFELPLILAGLYWIIKRHVSSLLFSWLLLAPIATSVTGLAHPLRSIYLLPIFPLLSAFGIYSLYKLLDNKKCKSGFILLTSLFLLTSFSLFIFRYFVIYPQISNWNFQDGYKSLFNELALIDKDFENVKVTKFYGEPHIFYLFYNNYDPKLYQNNIDVVRYDREDKWVSVDQIGRYYFFQEVKVLSPDKVSVVALSPQENTLSGKIIKEVNYKNNDVSFLILENEK